jgi:glycosyltransferase involved in cell wall biosynthesis
MDETPVAVLHTPAQGDRQISVTLDPDQTSHHLVSCLMVSRGTLFPGRYAIECFLRQTHANRELVVVVDAAADELIAHIDGLGDRRIRVVRLQAANSTIGELRNISIANAGGEYICQWDEDDLYAPGRIQQQLAVLLAAGASACVLRRLMLWWPGAGKLALSGERIWEGSILALKRAMPDYPALRYGEDAEMMADFILHERIVSLDAAGLYIFIYHGNNILDRRHFLAIYNLSRRRWVGAGYREKIAGLAVSVPLREYMSELSGAAPLEQEAQPEEAGPQPLVSIIVRSMGRPELRLALESLAAQDYQSLEVIVVDATGGNHPPLPEIDWRPGHTLRMAGGSQRLLRPHAANAGIDAVRGEWFGFLDDDDTFDPGHISELVQASARHPEAPVIYGLTRLLNRHNETSRLFGTGFNRSIMSQGPILYWQSSLIRRSVIGQGCRFDERLEVCEDLDFLAQIAQLGDFAFVETVNFNIRLDLGTSGTGQGANRDTTKTKRYEQLFQAKWMGNRIYHSQRSLRLSQRAQQAYAQGDKAEAEARLVHALREYPDDPNALNGLGYLYLERGELAAAENMLRRAAEINTFAGEYRINLATVLERTGHFYAARREARAALADVNVRGVAGRLLARLGDPSPHLEAGAETVKQRKTEPARAGPCPCGSGKRYKQCCGRLATPVASASPADSEARRAIATSRTGEACAAIDQLRMLAPAAITDAATAMACGDISQAMHQFELAYTFYRQAGVLGESDKAANAIWQSCQFWFRQEREASMLRTLHKQISRIAACRITPETEVSTADQVHLIGALGRHGGSAQLIVDLNERLAPHATVRIWSSEPPLPEFAERYPVENIDAAGGRIPETGHLVFAGVDFDYGNWLEMSRPSRITIGLETDHLEALIVKLVQFEEIQPGFTLDLIYPDARLGDAIGLPGVVRYPPVDTERFSPSRIRPEGHGPLMIGRHSRGGHSGSHPNDPAFYRQLVREGHRVRIAGDTGLAGALVQDIAKGGITLLPENRGGQVEFLAGLDCYIHRAHPHFYDAGSAEIMEAMSMALPVIAFSGSPAIAELIEHGRNGYLVDSENHAMECIRQLASSPELRSMMGAAARATMIEVMQRQGGSLRDFLLPAERRVRA